MPKLTLQGARELRPGILIYFLAFLQQALHTYWLGLKDFTVLRKELSAQTDMAKAFAFSLIASVAMFFDFQLAHSLVGLAGWWLIYRQFQEDWAAASVFVSIALFAGFWPLVFSTSIVFVLIYPVLSTAFLLRYELVDDRRLIVVLAELAKIALFLATKLHFRWLVQ